METVIIKIVIVLVLLYVFSDYKIVKKKRRPVKRRSKMMKPGQVVNYTDRKELITIENWN